MSLIFVEVVNCLNTWEEFFLFPDLRESHKKIHNFGHCPKKRGVSGEAKLFIEFKYGHVVGGGGA